MKKIAFHTLGCKLNFAESSALALRFEQAGWKVVSGEDAADLYVINTCTVTAEAEKKCRQLLHKLHRQQPQAEIAVAGCFSELRGEEIRQIEGVTYVIGTADKTRLLEMVQTRCNAQTQADAQTEAAPAAKATAPTPQAPFTPLYSAKGRTRSFFKVQDGCDNFCTFCAIPYARGRSRSATIEQTVKVAQEIAAAGYKEVVFTGVNIGDFGRKNGEKFIDLLRALSKIDGIERWRLSSIEPDLLHGDIIRMVADHPKFMPHFHIPLQAGSDAVLGAMKRHYNTALFAKKTEEIHRLMPHAFIAADVIVGFPTETAQDFDEGYSFIESLPVSALHVFSYSARPEAKSFHYQNAYALQEKEERSRRLHQLSDQKKEQFYEQFLGQKAVVLWESERVGNQAERIGNQAERAAEPTGENMLGYTENYLRVEAPHEPCKINTLESVTLGRSYLHPDKDRIMKVELCK